MEPAPSPLPEAACPGVPPATGPNPAGRAPTWLPPPPPAVSPAPRGWGSRDRGRPPDSGQDASRSSNQTFPRRGALSPPGTCWPCGQRECRTPKGAIRAWPGHGSRGRLSAGAAPSLPVPPPGGSGFDALEGPGPAGRGRRFPAPILGIWSLESRAQQAAPDRPRRSARQDDGYAGWLLWLGSRDEISVSTGRMEWRVEGPRHRSDRSPFDDRSLPIRQERALWGAITLLSLFAGAVTATPQIWHHNKTLGAPSYGSVGMASPAPVEEDIREEPSLAAWSPWHGDNMTVQGLSMAELLRAERSPASPSKAKKGFKNAEREGRRRNCRLHRLMVKVRDLGLGFESDEIVPFKYCSGSCQHARTNYDLTLSSLLVQRTIEPHDHLASHPCCRPTRYEDISFMDVRNNWQTVEKLSATKCSCVG
ncbi:artemin isoform X2 [Hemicordylus capensis]|uniref:artemin isoform X2 n=1 Tax=Hemicordylus capensis TaxID=884348 RepID=UPI002302396C|nr:artemin isoform X2 [Hemicordylus capensis]